MADHTPEQIDAMVYRLKTLAVAAKAYATPAQGLIFSAAFDAAASMLAAWNTRSDLIPNAAYVAVLESALKPFADAADARRRRDMIGAVCFTQDRLLAARAALAAPQPATDETIFRDGFPEGWYMAHRSDATLLCRKSDAGFAFAVSTAFAAAPKLMQGEAWLSTAQALAWGMVNQRKADMAYDEKTFCDHCGYGPKRDDNDKVLPNSLATKTWICDNCDRINVRSTQPAADTRVVTVAQLEEWADMIDWMAEEYSSANGYEILAGLRAIIGEVHASPTVATAQKKTCYTCGGDCGQC